MHLLLAEVLSNVRKSRFTISFGIAASLLAVRRSVEMLTAMNAHMVVKNLQVD